MPPAGKANADLLDWDSTTWRTNNTELMNMTSDQYVLIFTKAKNTEISISTFHIRFCQPLPRSKQYMFPELRSRMNALEHCGSLGNSRVVSFWEKKKTFISGGHVVVPKTEKQNLDVVAIAEQYYKVEKKVPNLLNNTTGWTRKIEICYKRIPDLRGEAEQRKNNLDWNQF